MGENREFLLAIALSIVVLLAWQVFVGMPQMEQAERQRAAEDSARQAQTQTSQQAPVPQSQAPALNQEREPLTVTVNDGGEIFLQDTKIELEDIVPRLNAITKQGYEERIYVRGDARVNYGQVMKVMGTIAGAGFKRVALVTATEDGG